MNLTQALRALGKVVLEEVDRNPDFAERLERALGRSDSPAQPAKKKARGRSPALLDPVAAFADRGEDALRDALRPLSLDQLLDIVAEFGMDSSKLVMKWKSADRVIEHVIDNARRRSAKGDAFRA